MKCFIHLTDEGIAVCKKCGKAMCMNCSAYSNHSGLCPECRREEFIKEREKLRIELKQAKSAQIMDIILAVIFTILPICAGIIWHPIIFVFLFVPIIFISTARELTKRQKEMTDKIALLTADIDKLGNALKRGASII